MAGFVGFKATGNFIAEDGGGNPKFHLVADGLFVSRVVAVGLWVALAASPCPPRKAVAHAVGLHEVFRLFDDFAVFVFAAALDGVPVVIALADGGRGVGEAVDGRGQFEGGGEDGKAHRYPSRLSFQFRQGGHEGVDVFACLHHGVDGGEVGDVCPPRRAVVLRPFAGEVFG